MTGKKQTILRTEQLKAFYLLEMHGKQKIVKAVNDVDMTIYENEIYVHSFPTRRSSDLWKSVV